MELVVVGINLLPPEEKTKLSLQQENTGRKIEKEFDFLATDINLLDKFDVELTDDEKYYFETGVEIIRK